MNAGNMTATPESVWAVIRETQKQLLENAQQQKETDRLLKESKAETDRILKDFSDKLAANDRMLKKSMDKLDNTLGRWSTNYGSFAEEYFIISFERGRRNFFGEKFDKMIKNAPGPQIKAEYDIVLINGKSIGIVEVKFKAHINDIPEVLHKAKTFRVNYPYYASHQIYLGLASLSFYPKLENECINEGIAVIKQVGDTVVINDAHLKVF